MLERDIERHLVESVKALGGEVRKLKWLGRVGAPDRLVLLPARQPNGQWPYVRPPRTIWVELKNPVTVRTFPASPRERAQLREHDRLRAMGLDVVVIGTIEQIEDLLQ